MGIKSVDPGRFTGECGGFVCAVMVMVMGCTDRADEPRAVETASLAVAESFIDAFYSWDSHALAQALHAPGDVERVLYYQEWARAASYTVRIRRPCIMLTSNEITCRITVTDDFGKTLGYTATDTFRLVLRDAVIVGVEFEGDDPPVFDELFAWIVVQHPDVMSGPCKDLFAGGKTPAACARAVVFAAQEFVK